MLETFEGLDFVYCFIYRKHTSGVSTVRWSPNATNVASGGSDAIAHVWQAE